MGIEETVEQFQENKQGGVRPIKQTKITEIRGESKIFHKECSAVVKQLEEETLSCINN